MNRQQLLDEIERLRVRLESVIDEHVAHEAAQNPSVPRQMLRQIVSQNSGCVCSVVKNLLKEKEPIT